MLNLSYRTCLLNLEQRALTFQDCGENVKKLEKRPSVGAGPLVDAYLVSIYCMLLGSRGDTGERVKDWLVRGIWEGFGKEEAWS